MELTRRQADLVGAALRVLDRDGISGCTMRVLAAEAGLSPMAAYKHFENQRELHLFLWRESMRAFDAYVRDNARLDDADPLGSLVSICRAFIDYGLMRPHRFELVFAHPFVREVRKEEWLVEDRFRMSLLATRVVESGRSSGEIRSDLETAELLVFAVGLLVGLTQSLISDRAARLAQLPDEQLKEASLRLLHDALRPRPAGSGG